MPFSTKCWLRGLLSPFSIQQAGGLRKMSRSRAATGQCAPGSVRHDLSWVWFFKLAAVFTGTTTKHSFSFDRTTPLPIAFRLCSCCGMVGIWCISQTRRCHSRVNGRLRMEMSIMSLAALVMTTTMTTRVAYWLDENAVCSRSMSAIAVSVLAAAAAASTNVPRRRSALLGGTSRS